MGKTSRGYGIEREVSKKRKFTKYVYADGNYPVERGEIIIQEKERILK